MKNLFLMLLVVCLSSCSTYSINAAMRNYESIKTGINLGDRVEYVEPKLNQAMKNLPPDLRKQPDQYIKRGVKVEIHYARTGWQSDGLTTDDEFTPYVFNNGVLVAIGWKTIGGVKSVGQAPPQTIINNPAPIIIY